MAKGRKIETQNIDPARIFASADEYYELDRFINNLGENFKPQFAMPGVVVSALALELYFKCLILLNGKTYDGIHYLDELFECLDGPLKKMIREDWNAHQLQETRSMILKMYNQFKEMNKTGDQAVYDRIIDHPEKIDFDWCLKSSSKAFAAFRYEYEPRKPGEPAPAWYGGGMLTVARNAILKIKPEWKSASRGWIYTPSTSPTQ